MCLIKVCPRPKAGYALWATIEWMSNSRLAIGIDFFSFFGRGDYFEHVRRAFHENDVMFLRVRGNDRLIYKLGDLRVWKYYSRWRTSEKSTHFDRTNRTAKHEEIVINWNIIVDHRKKRLFINTCKQKTSQRQNSLIHECIWRRWYEISDNS